MGTGELDGRVELELTDEQVIKSADVAGNGRQSQIVGCLEIPIALDGR